MLQIKNNSPYNFAFYDGSGITNPLPYPYFVDRYEEAFYLEMDHLIPLKGCNSPQLAANKEGFTLLIPRSLLRGSLLNTLVHDEEPPVTGEDGLKALAISLAATKSLKENRPVKIEEV